MAKVPIFILCILVASMGVGALTLHNQASPTSVSPSTTFTHANLYVNESGLPSGTAWSITVTGIDPYGEPLSHTMSGTSSQLVYNGFEFNSIVKYSVSPSGSGAQPYNPSPATGSLTLSNPNDYLDISFHAAQGNLFTINIPGGLPADEHGQNWKGYFTNNGTYTQGINTGATSLSFVIPNGTYYFQFNGTSYYTPSVPNGYFTVDGNNYTLTVTFSLNIEGSTYGVNFIEQGLPTGHSWTLHVDGPGVNVTESSYAATISVNLTGGDTYNYTANATGYTYIGQQGSFTFNTFGQNVYMPFQNPGAPARQHLNTLTEYIGLSVTAFFAVVTSIVGIITAIMVARHSDDIIFPAVALVVIAWVARAVGGVQTGYAVLITVLAIAAFFIGSELNKGQEVQAV